MKNKPLAISIISLLYFISPLSVFLQVMVLTNLPLKYFYLTVYHFNWHSWVLIISGPIVGYGIYKVREWGFYLFIYHAMFLIINNTVVFFGDFSTLPWYVYILFNLVVLVLIGILLRKEIYAPYFNPKIRWWEQAKRYFPPTAFQATVFKNEEKIDAQLGDISEGGAYIITDIDMNVGDSIGFEFKLEDTKELKTKALVVWTHNGSRVDIPKGAGCMFLDPGKEFVTVMKAFFKKANASVKRV